MMNSSWYAIRTETRYVGRIRLEEELKRMMVHSREVRLKYQEEEGDLKIE